MESNRGFEEGGRKAQIMELEKIIHAIRTLQDTYKPQEFGYERLADAYHSLEKLYLVEKERGAKMRLANKILQQTGVN
jgi:hypothetical protein